MHKGDSMKHRERKKVPYSGVLYWSDGAEATGVLMAVDVSRAVDQTESRDRDYRRSNRGRRREANSYEDRESLASRSTTGRVQVVTWGGRENVRSRLARHPWLVWLQQHRDQRRS